MSSILSKLINLAGNITGTLPVVNGGTGVTTSTGSGNVVLSTSPTLVTPILGTPASGTLTNCTGYPVAVPGTSAGLVSASGVPGNATGSAIASGYVGEYPEFSTTTTNSLATNQITGIVNGSAVETGITLTAGVWDIQGIANFLAAATTSVSLYEAFIGTATGNSNTGRDLNRNSVVLATAAGVNGGNNVILPTPAWRVTLSSPTTYYLKVVATFTASTMSVMGTIRATRIA